MPTTRQYQSAYKKRATRKKKVAGPKKPAVPYRYQVADTAFKAYKGAMYLKGLINVERKFYDTTTSVAPDFTGVQYTLNNISQGSTDGSRNGDSVLIKSINVSGVINITSAAAAIVRILIIRDKADTIHQSELLTNNGTKYVVNSPFIADYTKQYTILHDKTFLINSNNDHQLFQFFTNGIDKHTVFNNGTTTINTNSYKICLFSTLNTNMPTVDFVTRITYYDN